MTAADLIQVLMKDENIDKEILIVQRRPAVVGTGWRPVELRIADTKDFGSTLELMVDLPEPEECDEPHCDHEQCECLCDACTECEWK